MEEDLKILEEIKNMFIHLKSYGWINDIKRDIDTDKAIQAIENTESRLKQLEEENKELLEVKISASAHNQIEELRQENEELKNLANNKQWISPYYVAQNYIPVSLVKEKIEELKEIADEDNQDEYIKIEVLQELLGEE